MTFIIKLKWFFKQRWVYYVMTISLLILVNLMQMIPPSMIGAIIDQIRTESLTRERSKRKMGWAYSIG